MEFPIKITLPKDMYDQDVIELTKINLFFGINGSGKSITLKQILKQLPRSFFIDENRHFVADIISRDQGNTQPSFIGTHFNLSHQTILDEINEILEQLFFNRKLNKISSIGSMNSLISIKKLEKNFTIGSDGRGIWNVVKPLEALTLCDVNSGILIEEFSLGLYPGMLSKYYELFKEKLINKKSFLVTTTQDPFLVYQFIKNKINDRFEWDDKEPDVSLFKFMENENQKIVIEKIDEKTNTSSLKEILGDYLEGIEIHKFSYLFSNIDERTSN